MNVKNITAIKPLILLFLMLLTTVYGVEANSANFPANKSCVNPDHTFRPAGVTYTTRASCFTGAFNYPTPSIDSCALKCTNGDWFSGSNSGVTTTCPTNSTLSGSQCSPNAGYSAVNNNGTWSVVPTGSECTSGSYNATTGQCEASPYCGTSSEPNTNASCTCQSGNKSYSTNGYYCTTTADEASAVAIFAAFLGISGAIGLGVLGGLTACISTIACTGLLAVAALATLLPFGLSTEGDTSQSINSSASLQVTLAPIGASPERQNNTVRIGGLGELVPPLNATQDPAQQGRYIWTSGTKTATVDTTTNTLSYSDSATPNTHTLLTTNGNQAPLIRQMSTSNFGTSSTGSPVKKITTSTASPTRTAVNTDAQTQVTYEQNGNLTTSPPAMAVCASPDCQITNGAPVNVDTSSLNKEATQQAINAKLGQIQAGQCGGVGQPACQMEFNEDGVQDVITNTQTAHQGKLDEIDSWFDALINTAENQTGGVGEGFSTPLTDLLPASGSCTNPVFDATNIHQGAYLELPLCEHANDVQPFLTWAASVFTIFAIWGLMFTKVGGT